MRTDTNETERTVSSICRSDGTTPAERYLKKLCDRSFLSLWSYPGVYRDQGKSGTKGDGKEVCDLLVVFENHIIIFSDKDCEFPSTGNVELDWSRWYRKAIQKSAEQVWGAERWILSHPNRLFLDRACAVPFPIDLPDSKVAKVHRVVVAHSASKPCVEAFGGSGSLIIAPQLTGEMHSAPLKDGGIPFAVGHINPSKGYVHVFDDTTLDIVMTKLDTITDFLGYLTKKEKFIASGKLTWAPGEHDLLAYYLQNYGADEEHDFIVPPDTTGVAIAEGLWEEYSNSAQRRAQLLADEISYAWDKLIETFSRHILAGTSYHLSHPGVENHERYLRLLAREPRTARRMLASALLELIDRTPKSIRATRTIFSSRDEGKLCYVFLLLPHPKSVQYDKYRQVRMELLKKYCMVTRLNVPVVQEIVGIATETGRAKGGSEDIAYVDARSWTPEHQTEARRLKSEMANLGLLGEYQGWMTTAEEYPDPPNSVDQQPASAPSVSMKGRGRNQPCHCRSGKKVKRCCGQ